MKFHLSSGHAVVTPDGDALIVSNLEKGVDIYSLPPERVPVQIPHKSLARKTSQRGIPLLVSASGQIVVAGTDCGVAQVFSDSMKEPLDLPHWNYTTSRFGGRWRNPRIEKTQKMVQIVTVSDLRPISYKMSAYQVTRHKSMLINTG